MSVDRRDPGCPSKRHRALGNSGAQLGRQAHLPKNVSWKQWHQIKGRQGRATTTGPLLASLVIFLGAFSERGYALKPDWKGFQREPFLEEQGLSVIKARQQLRRCTAEVSSEGAKVEVPTAECRASALVQGSQRHSCV